MSYPPNDRYMAKLDEQATKASIKALLSEADYYEYSRLIDRFKKGKYKDVDKEFIRREKTLAMMRAFLEGKPQMTVLYNRLARLEVVVERSSPLPVIEDAGGENLGAVAATMSHPSTPAAQSSGINKTNSDTKPNTPKPVLEQLGPKTSKRQQGRKTSTMQLAPKTSKAQQKRPQVPTRDLRKKIVPPKLSIPDLYWNTTFEIYEIPIQNPEVFPTHLITNLKNAQLTELEECRDETGAVTNISAILENHPDFDFISICSYNTTAFDAIGVQHDTIGILKPPPTTNSSNLQFRLVQLEGLKPETRIERDVYPIAVTLETMTLK